MRDSTKLRGTNNQGRVRSLSGITTLGLVLVLAGCSHAIVPKGAEPQAEISVVTAAGLLPMEVRPASHICSGNRYRIEDEAALQTAVSIALSRHDATALPASTEIRSLRPSLECHAERWRTRCTADVEVLLAQDGETVTRTGHAEGPAGWRCQKVGHLVVEALGEALVQGE